MGMMRTILLIEDDVSLNDLMAGFLRQSGFEVLGVYNGVEGLRAYRQTACDVVITDILMPEMEGLEMIIEMKQLNPAVRIIAITGGGYHGNQDHLLECAKCFGAEHILKKPIVLGDLVALLHSMKAGSPSRS